MTMNKKIVATGLSLFSFLLPLEATAATFSNLYTFGDSLVDTGNAFNLTGSPQSPPYERRFSNGPVWVEYLAEDLGLSLNPFFGGFNRTEGIDFAIGGASTGTTNPIITGITGLPSPTGLQNQIDLFKTTNPAADPDALHVVWAGAVDYLFGGETDPSEPVANLSNAVSELAAVGAKNILVTNLPDLGELPRTRNTPISDNLNTLTAQHNSALSTTLNDLSQSLDPNVNLISFDVNTVFDQVLANPGAAGFTNVTDSCLTNYTFPLDTDFDVCDNPDQFLFWDDIHPTTFAHEQIANFALATLEEDEHKSVPEPASALGILAFSALGAGTVLKRKRRKARAA